MSVFVTLDGVDGAGKTTVGKLLEQRGKYKYFKSPSSPFSELRSEVDNHANAIERYCFYRLATFRDSETIRSLTQHSSVICDRYVASTLVYHLAMDARIAGIHDNSGLLVPDFAVLLLVGSDEREKRIMKRASVTSDKRIEQDRSLLDKVQATFLNINDSGLLPFKLIPLETDGRSEEEIVDAIENLIE